MLSILSFNYLSMFMILALNNNFMATVIDFTQALMSFVSPVLIAILIFFFRRQIKSSDNVVASNYSLISRLDKLETAKQYTDKSCESKHTIVDNRLNAHSKQLHEHSVEIAKLKSHEN